MKLKKKRIAYLKLGQKIRFVKLTINTEKGITKEIFKINKLHSYLLSISKKEEKKGHLFSETKLENIFLKKDSLFADVYIKKSKKRDVNKIIVKGYPEFSQKGIKHFLNIKKNDLINNKKINEISNTTKQLAFIS